MSLCRSEGISSFVCIQSKECECMLNCKIPEAPLMPVSGKREPFCLHSDFFRMFPENSKVFRKKIVFAAREHEPGKLIEFFSFGKAIQDCPYVFF